MNRRGFASLTAIVLIALVGVAVAAMGRHFAYEARRTRHASTDAQLRQLLHAGAVAAVERSRQWTDAPTQGKVEISLPSAAAGRLILTTKPPADGPISIAITANLDDRSAEQVLEFERAGGVWSLRSATTAH